ncbi:M56 family metallopeptidase [Hymenobacter sp.]|uniref:M56 family metallopeptidase n=1 Tax=Hymenobacter sp. TaxID=1898978 RepID=UPI00286D1E46|nr:M56 family metallopeptidase [Hymenobacter sp.]
MTALENFVSPALTRALGWTLLHSLWQGALVAAVLAGALLLLRRQRAEVRYVASAGALGAVVALAGITFGLYLQAGAGSKTLQGPGAVKNQWALPVKSVRNPPVPASSASGGAPAAASSAQPENTAGANGAKMLPTASAAVSPAAAAPDWLASGLRYFDRHLPLLVVAWLLGLLAMSLRLLGGLLYVQRLRRYRVRPLSAAWQERLAVLAARSGVRRPVALLESALVRVPLVVGHVRPVILLPLGAVAGLAPGHLEAILAHELAHVLRRDYLVNLLQTVAEALFFYHPAVWFVANCVRTERENCCDDAATALVGGDPLRLARALTALAEWSQSAVVPAAPRLALAAMGGRGALLSRVRRLVQRRPAAPTLAEGLMAGALVLGGLGLLGSSVVLAGPLARPTQGPVSKPAALDGPAGPSRNSTDTTKRSNGSAATTFETDEAMPPLTPLSPPDAAPLDLAGELEEDTVVRRRAMRTIPERARGNRRVIVDGREMAPSAFQRGAGTVVVTKDTKGRLTDLVVNGQRVETETGGGKTKGRKGGDSQQVEIIRVVPADAPEMRGFVYRSDGEGSDRFGREFRREYDLRTRRPDNQIRSEIRSDVFGKGFSRTYGYNLNGNANRNFTLVTPGAFGPDPTASLRKQREALRTAERALLEALAVKNLSTEQRKRLNKRLAEVRDQLKQTESASSAQQLRLGGAGQPMSEDLRERQEEMRERQEELHDREEELRERQREMQEDLRERRQEQQENMRERQQELREQQRARADRDREGNEAFVAELVKDGLIRDKENFQVRLTARSLVVDGKEQPRQVFQKYLKLYESKNGRKMSATGTMMISRNSDTTIEGDGMAPPPRPPRPPRAPRAALAPTAPLPPLAPDNANGPAAPLPPLAPGPDTQALRDELRKDGLIGPNDKSFQVQLNGAGLTVNGKRQPEEMAAKYRKLTGHDDGKTFNMTISTQE